MDTRTITAEGSDGHQHAIRITHGPGDDRHVVCDSCGYRRRAAVFARARAEQHLTDSHGASGLQVEYRALPYVLWLIAFIVFVVVMAGMRP
ncbi:hypothetical protein ACWGB8_21785 [Kitasatospora sp. NPDC054939]